MKEIVLTERKKDVESLMKGIFHDINKVHNKSSGLYILIRQAGTENEISVLIGKMPSPEERTDSIMVENEGIMYQVTVTGFERHDENICAAIIALGEVLDVSATYILNYMRANKVRVPHSYIIGDNDLHKILDKAIWKHLDRKMLKGKFIKIKKV